MNLYLQIDRLIPHGIKGSLDGFGFLLDAVRVWNQLELHVRIAEPVRVHRNEIATLFDWWREV